MFKKIFLVLLCFFPLFSLPSYEILPQTPENLKLGFDNICIATDGELSLMQFLLEPGNLVIDAGANFGEWSKLVLKTQPTCKVMAFEPIPYLFEQLKANFKETPNVNIFNCALSDQKGISNFYCYGNNALSGFYYREVLQGNPEIISVPQDTLVNFCTEFSIDRIDFLKIDTEGAELKILNGAKPLLKNHLIRALQFEYGGTFIDAKITLKQVLELLTKYEYLIFRIIPNGLIHISKWDDSLENYNLCNYFAIYRKDFKGFKLLKL